MAGKLGAGIAGDMDSEAVPSNGLHGGQRAEGSNARAPFPSPIRSPPDSAARSSMPPLAPDATLPSLRQASIEPVFVPGQKGPPRVTRGGAHVGDGPNLSALRTSHDQMPE